MSKQWRLIVGSAILGFVVAALILLYINLSAEFEGRLYTAFVILCPPSLLCIPFADTMKDRVGFYGIWSLIGLANSGLYAIIAAAVAGQLWKSD